MERKHPQDSPADSPAGQLRPTETAPNFPPTQTRVGGVESLPALRAELKQAADEARLGHYEAAQAKLEQLLATLRQASTSTSRDEAHDPIQMFLLQAAALVACAQIREQLEQPAQAQAAFKQAAALFKQWLQPDASASGQDYCDYGVALYKLEQLAEARAAFQEALKRGVSDAQTNYYLGLLAQGDNAHEQAREYLTKAAELEPGDLGIHLALATSLAGLGQMDEAASTYRDVAFSLYKAKRRDDALTVLDLALKVKPDDYRARLGRADLLREQGQYEEALANVEQSLQLQPDNVYALGTKGQILRALLRFNEAEEVLRRALALDAAQDWLHAELAATLLALNRIDDARAPLEKALELGPDNPFTLALKAHLLHTLSQYADAVPIFERALSADPTQDWVYPELGFDLIMLSRYEEALKVLEGGFARQPQDTAPLLGLRGEALRYLGRYQEALSDIEQALTLRPDNPFLLGWKGELLSLLGRYQEAIEVLQQAIALAPELDWVYAHLSSAFNSLQRYDEALKAADQALARNTASAQALRNKGEALRRLGRHEDALRALDEALVVEPDNAYALGTKGQVLVALERNEEALAPLERAYELDKASWVFTALGLARLALGHFDELLKLVDQVLAQQPNDVVALELKGDALRRRGEHEQAVELFNRLLSVAPDNAAVLRMKGEVLLKQGNYTDALQALDRSLIIEPGDVSALQLRGETLRRSERYEEALQPLDAALVSVPDDAWRRRPKFCSGPLRGMEVSFGCTASWARSITRSTVMNWRSANWLRRWLAVSIRLGRSCTPASSATSPNTVPPSRRSTKPSSRILQWLGFSASKVSRLRTMGTATAQPHKPLTRKHWS